VDAEGGEVVEGGEFVGGDVEDRRSHDV
jgi:hypothetical protein